MGHDPVLNSLSGRNPRQGQAIIMVVLSLFAMCGVLGLAVDFGWAYFVKRAAQGAADSAAIAAAEEMRRMVGFSGPYPCLQGGVCRDDNTPYVCTSTVINDTADNLDNACLYAKQNGFAEAGKQRVRVSEGTDSAAPTVPGVPLQYWVTVRVTESVPQLFAAMTGNPVATVSARATAGIYLGQTRGSIILLNRNQDVPLWGGGNNVGVNLANTGNGNIRAGGGILMASGCAGANCSGNYAGALQGNTASVTAPYTNIRLGGNITVSGQNNPPRWDATPQNGFQEGSEFQDPTRRKSQPPISDANLADCYVEGGLLEPSTPGGTLNLGPGNYYATRINRNGEQEPTGAPIKISGNVNFLSGGSCRNGTSNPNAFSTYVIYGGIETKSGNGTTNMNFESGAIVMAGVTPKTNGDASALFDMSVGGSGFNITGPGPDAAGNLFLFTSSNYPGLTRPPINLTRYSAIYEGFKQGTSGFKSGNNQSVSFTLDGLNKDGAGFPANLKPYDSAVMWQDRRNSTIAYNDDGTYGCSPPYESCQKTSQQITAHKVTNGSPGMFIAAGANTVIRGTIYQPRGAWATVQAAAGMSSALQLITGALQVQGGGNIILNPVTTALPQSIVGLVE